MSSAWALCSDHGVSGTCERDCAAETLFRAGTPRRRARAPKLLKARPLRPRDGEPGLDG